MKRFKIVAIISAIIFVGILLAYFGTEQEPQYQGRSLTDWVNQSVKCLSEKDDPEHPENNPQWLACRVAVRKMGTNVIPFLLKNLLAEQSTWEPKVDAFLKGPVFSSVTPKSWGEKLRLLLVKRHSSVIDKKAFALCGFALLERDAQLVEPVLIKLTKDPDREKRFWSFGAFVCIKPPKEIFMPVATGLLKDPDDGVRTCSAGGIIDLYPDEAEKAGVFVLFPELRSGQTNGVQVAP